MRSTLWLTFIGVCFAAFVLRTASSDASARPPAQQAMVSVTTNATAPDAAFKQNVEGFGETEDDARNGAIEKAVEKVADYLKEKHHETDYKPSPGFLQEHKMIPPTGDIPVTNNPIRDLPNMKKATLEVRVSDENVKLMQEEARQQRVAQRQHWLSVGLAGFIALLLVGAGYLRLEEATKGYYTGLLRVTALTFLGAAAGAIWYLS
jgi:hypothetical protein